MTAFNAPTYDIERPTGVCAFTGRTLEVGESYVATLVELDPADPGTRQSGAAALGMKRLDVSLPAWQAGQRPPRLFCHWKSTVPQPNQKRRLFVDDEVLMSLFLRLGEVDDPQKLAFRFVLGLILMRKKRLRYDGDLKQPGTDGRDREVWLMVPRGQEQPVEMLNPQMDEDKISQVTAQLGEILQAEL